MNRIFLFLALNKFFVNDIDSKLRVWLC